MQSFGKAFLRHLARLVTLVAVLFFTFAAIYMITENFWDMRSSASVVIVILLALCILSGVFSFVHTRLGGLFLLASGSLLLGYLLVKGNLLSAAVYGLPFIVAGVLQLLAPEKKRRSARVERPAPRQGRTRSGE